MRAVLTARVVPPGVNARSHGIATTCGRRLHRPLGRQRLQSCPLMDRLPGHWAQLDVKPTNSPPVTFTARL